MPSAYRRLGSNPARQWEYEVELGRMRSLSARVSTFAASYLRKNLAVPTSRTVQGKYHTQSGKMRISWKILCGTNTRLRPKSKLKAPESLRLYGDGMELSA